MTKGKILVVEDDKMLSSILIKELSDSGYSTRAVYDGGEAVSAAEEFRPDLILLDLLLPNKDGFTILKELKEIHMTKDIPVLVLSNLGTTEDIEKAKEGGAVAYLVKINYSPWQVAEKAGDFFLKGAQSLEE